MVLGWSDEEADDGDRDRRQLVAKLKQRFPDCSEELILELTFKLRKDVDQIVEVLKQNSNHFQPETESRYLPKHPSMLHEGMMYPGQEKTAQNTKTQRPAYFVSPYYTLPSEPGFHRYSFTSEELPNPAGVFLQRRAISTDRLSNRRTDVSEIRRERSASDVTHTLDASFRSYASPYSTIDPARVFPGQHRSRLDGNSLDQEEDRLIQHIQLQQEYLARMQTKVNALKNDVSSILEQIYQEEQDLNTRSKVQRNPTEKDVQKLKQEIDILRKEVFEANIKLERVREGASSGSSPVHISTLPGGIHDERPQEPSRPQTSMNEIKPSFSPLSGPRFPLMPLNIPSTLAVHPSDQHSLSNPPQQLEISPQNPIGNMPDNNDNVMWSCRVCTLDNHPDLQECEACGSKR